MFNLLPHHKIFTLIAEFVL